MFEENQSVEFYGNEDRNVEFFLYYAFFTLRVPI